MASTGINVAARSNCWGTARIPARSDFSLFLGGSGMSDVIGGRQWRRVALSLVLGSIVIGMGAIPALAATTPVTATYPDERTTFHPCPQGFPPRAVCFTGVGHGVTEVGTTILNGTE